MKLDALSRTRKLLAFNTINPPGDERDGAQFKTVFSMTAALVTNWRG